MELSVVSQSLRCIQERVYHNTIINGIFISNDLPNTMSSKLKITHSDLNLDARDGNEVSAHRDTLLYVEQRRETRRKGRNRLRRKGETESLD